MEKYLRCLEAENAFCIQFHSRDIHHLLCGLAQDYRNIPMNLYLLSEHSLLPKSTGQYLEVTLQKFVSVIGNAVK